MRNLIKNTFVWFIIVGSIAWATAVITGNTLPTFITPYTIEIGTYTKTLYRLDVYNYLRQIENISINIPIDKLFYDPPSLPNIEGVTDIFKLLPNLFIWLINMEFWWLNIILIAPTKLLIYPLAFFVTILGIDINSNQIIQLINVLITVKMPIIEYI